MTEEIKLSPNTEKIVRFSVFDWMILCGCILMLLFSIHLIVSDVISSSWSTLLIDFGIWFIIPIYGLKAKFKKFKEVKTKKALKMLLISTGAIFIIILGYTFFSIFNSVRSIDTKYSLNTPTEWVQVISSNQKFSMTLPKNWSILTNENGVGKIETYAYFGEELDGFAHYVVKYENYESAFKQANIESLDDTAELNFLKGLVDEQVKELNISNFSSQFTKTKGYNSIRYQGIFNDDNQSLNIEGIMLLAEKISYSVVAISKQGYTNNLERVLDGLSIK